MYKVRVIDYYGTPLYTEHTAAARFKTKKDAWQWIDSYLREYMSYYYYISVYRV